MATIKASVIIPTKNPGPIFREVVEAVLGQDAPWPYEIVVIDSGSEDGTLEYLKKLDRVYLLQIKPIDFGHGRTRNEAIAQSRGEFCALLTHDAKPADNQWLARIVEKMDTAPDIAGVFGRHLAYPESGPYVAKTIDDIFDECLKQEDPIKIADINRYTSDVQHQRQLHFFSNNNSCIRKKVWQQIPFPDVSFAEDQAWAKLALENGYSLAYADKAAVYHSHHFGPIETLMRCFDEAKALNEQFGYKFCSKLSRVFQFAIRNARKQIRFSRETGNLRAHFKWILLSPILNISHYLGLYLGERSHSTPLWLTRILSRDQRMQSKKLSANPPTDSNSNSKNHDHPT